MSAKTVTYACLERLKTLKMRQSRAETFGCFLGSGKVFQYLRSGLFTRAVASRIALILSASLGVLMKECFDKIPDVRDGLTREERVVLYVLNETQKERGDRNVPTAMLWGRVCEHFYISAENLSALLARLGARK
jgi:hypothetical protein